MRPHLSFGSLFSGIGGIDLGFERAGLICKWQVEIDQYANRVLAKHWPNVRRHNDVRTWPQPDSESVDVIAGGFPCQDISYAGKGAGLHGERSGLFFEFARIVGEMGPRFIVMENVSALLTRGLDQVLGTLASIGYDAEWHCIPAASLGAPHIRDRVFILGYANRCRGETGEQARTTPRHGIPSSTASANAASMANSESVGRKTCGTVIDSNSYPEGVDREGESCGNRFATDSYGTRLEERQRKDADRTWAYSGAEFSRSQWWEFEPDVGRVANGIPRRVDRLRGLGNAVVPQVAEWIARRLIQVSENN